MLPILTKNNHFRFGFDALDFSKRKNADQAWQVSYGQCTRTPLPFKEECIETAHLIRRSTQESLWVCFSGGIDSEVVARSFLAAGIDFNCAILRFPEQLNEHDIRWAREFCESRSLPYRYFDIDPREFWRTNALAYAEMGQCCSIGMTLLFWLAEQIPGYPIFGSGECHLVDDVEKIIPRRKLGAHWLGGLALHTETDKDILLYLDKNFGRPRGKPQKFRWHLSEKENIAGLYRFFMALGKEGAPGFFQYTPEIMASFLNDPTVIGLTDNLLINSPKGTHTSEDLKHDIYSSYWPIERRKKATGFEKLNLSNEFVQLQKRLFWSFGDASDIFYTNVADLRKNWAIQ